MNDGQITKSGHKTRKGATILMIMIVISAVILILAMNMGITSVMQNQINMYQTAGNELSFHLDGCAGEALARLNRDNGYTGETLDMDGTNCLITVTGTGATRAIEINATATNYTKNLQIDVIIWPIFTITAWNV